MTNQDFFLFFLRYKIDSGVKQIDIVRSEHTTFSSAYVNKLYHRPPKHCSLEVQTSIAKFFGLTYEEMIEEAQRLFHQQQEAQDRRPDPQQVTPTALATPLHSSNSPINLIDQLTAIAGEIRESYSYSQELEKNNDRLLEVLNSIKTGISIIDSNLTVEYQNIDHKRVFGDRTGTRYTFFWADALEKKEMFRRLAMGEYDNVQVQHNGNRYLVKLTTLYKGNRVDGIIENVINIQEQEERHRVMEKQLKIYSQIFNKLDTGFGFFNANRQLELATNKFGLLDDYDFPTSKPTVDQLLLNVGDKFENWCELQPLMKKAYDNKEEIEIKVTTKEGDAYTFQTRVIVDDSTYLGTVLIIRKAL